MADVAVKHLKFITSITTITGAQKASDDIKDAVIGAGVPVIIDRSSDETNPGMFYVIGDGVKALSALTEYAMITGTELAGYVSPDELYEALGAPEDHDADEPWSIIDAFTAIKTDFEAEGDNSELTNAFESAVDAVISNNSLVTSGEDGNFVATATALKDGLKDALGFLEEDDQYLKDADALKTEALALVNDNNDPLFVTTEALTTALGDYVLVDEETGVTNDGLAAALANLAKLDFSNLTLGEGEKLDLAKVITTDDFVVGNGTGSDDIKTAFVAA